MIRLSILIACVLYPSLSIAQSSPYTVPGELQSRIRQHRTRQVEVRFLDHAGRPVGNQPVHVRLTRHGFLFGTTLPMPNSMGSLNDWYRKELVRLFNFATTENLLKWSVFEADRGHRQYAVADEYVAWCRANGIRLKGHALVWGDMQGMPAWLQEEDISQLMSVLEKHVRDLVRTYKESIHIWDVVNEPIHRNEWEMIDRDYIGKAFHWAREENPDAVLVINEFGILSNPDDADAYLALITKLIDDGVPVDAIGLQAHTGGKRFSVEHMDSVFRRAQAIGLPVHITEFDVPIDTGLKVREQSEKWTKESQGQYYGEFVARCFADPAVEALTIWGHYHTWSKGAALFDENLQPKPNWRVFDYLMNQEWRTDVTVTTSADGRANFRGFLGDYSATWSGGQAQFHIDKKSERVVVRPD